MAAFDPSLNGLYLLPFTAATKVTTFLTNHLLFIDQSGAYLTGAQVNEDARAEFARSKASFHAVAITPECSYGTSQEDGERLWALSEELVKEKFKI